MTEDKIRSIVQYIKNEMCVRSIDEITEQEVIDFAKSTCTEILPDKIQTAEEYFLSKDDPKNDDDVVRLCQCF